MREWGPAPFPWNWALCDFWGLVVKHFHRVLGLPALEIQQPCWRGAQAVPWKAPCRSQLRPLTDSWRQPPPMSDQESRQRQPLSSTQPPCFHAEAPESQSRHSIPTESVSIKKKKKKRDTFLKMPFCLRWFISGIIAKRVIIYVVYE